MLASAAMAAVAAKCQVPVFLGAMAVLANNGLVALAWRSRRLPLWLSLRVHRAQQRLHSASRWRPLQRRLFSPRLQLALTGSALNSRSSGSCSSAGVSASSGKFSAGGARPRSGASAVAAQVIACSAAALAPTKGCCLTLRSWGLPPARHLARVAVVLIIGLAGQAPSRRQPLSSNVRPRGHSAGRVLAASAHGQRRETVPSSLHWPSLPRLQSVRWRHARSTVSLLPLAASVAVAVTPVQSEPQRRPEPRQPLALHAISGSTQHLASGRRRFGSLSLSRAPSTGSPLPPSLLSPCRRA